MKKLRIILCFIVVSILACNLCGCTLMGNIVKNIIDNHTSEPQQITSDSSKVDDEDNNEKENDYDVSSNSSSGYVYPEVPLY